MLIPCNIHVIAGVEDFATLYAVYVIRDAGERVQYVGVSLLPELFELPDARNNSEWVNVFGKPFAVLNVEVTALTTNEREAFAEQRRLIGIHDPHCNMRGYFVATKYQSVICNETQETWPNANQAAKAHGIDPTALGHHLKRKPGFKSVKGRTYSYFVRSPTYR